MTVQASNEVEGVPLQGARCRAAVPGQRPVEFISTGGYYHSLPGDALRRFIDASAEAQAGARVRQREGPPGVAPSQFEMNYGHTEACVAADQVQLYKLICRQVAAADGHDGQLPAQAGRRRQRQRHAPRTCRSPVTAAISSGIPPARTASPPSAGRSSIGFSPTPMTSA